MLVALVLPTIQRLLMLYDSIERLFKSRKKMKFLMKKVFDTSYFGFSGHKMLSATKSVG